MKQHILIFLMLISIFSFAQNKKTTAKKITKKTAIAKLPKDVEIWTIDAQRAKCEGAITMQCLLVKKQGDKDFNLFYSTIDGFDYQEGFVYTLWVKKTMKTSPIPADASIYNYSLVKLVNKKPIVGYSNTTADYSKPMSGMNTSENVTLIVNEEKVPCEGNPNTMCLLIKKENAKTFEIFYQNIEGFNFEKGVRQTILVNERQLANAMVKEAKPIYTLIKVLKKEQIFVPELTATVDSNSISFTLNKKWFLREMKENDTSTFEITDNGVWLQIDNQNNKINGKAPCNTYFGGFNSDNISTFQTIVVANSRMFCDEKMKFEDLYFTLLQNADNFQLKDGKLLLSKGKRLLLIFE